jgi:hypothetical protein
MVARTLQALVSALGPFATDSFGVCASRDVAVPRKPTSGSSAVSVVTGHNQTFDCHSITSSSGLEQRRRQRATFLRLMITAYFDYIGAGQGLTIL